MVSFLDIAAVLLCLSAAFGWLNRKYLHVPEAGGLLVIGLVLANGIEYLYARGAGAQHHSIANTLLRVDFSAVVLNGMLCFLLFAGAYEIDFDALRNRAWPTAALAVLGTAVSAVLTGVLAWCAGQVLNPPLSFGWALVFGAVVSPTDPVAVLSTLRAMNINKAIEVELQGEALFNDGVGVVFVTLLLSFAAGQGGTPATGWEITRLVLEQVPGGLGLGFLAGSLAYLAMRRIDDFIVEVLITLALVTGTYAAAEHLGASGPLAVVVAGLIIGDRGVRHAMSDRTRRYVTGFWKLIDEILNSILFLLIGLETVVVSWDRPLLLFAGAAIPIVMCARLLGVAAPLLIPAVNNRLSIHNLPFLTWAGIRGGVSVALGLSLPESDAKLPIVAATYAVVFFTIFVQAPTLGWVARRTGLSEGSSGRQR